MRLSIFAAAVVLALASLASGSASAVPEFKRGINLLKPFNLPSRTRDGGYKDPPFDSPLSRISDAEMARFAALGFDHVRLTIDPGVFLDSPPDKRSRLDGELRAFILRLQKAKLSVLIDPHPMPGPRDWAPDRILTSLDAPKFVRYRDFVLDLARFAGGLDPDRVALGLMNEPQRACFQDKGTDWTVFQKALFDAVRAAEPALPIVVTPGCFSSLKGLQYLDPANFDQNTLYDVHYYDPYIFTHQSPGWASEPFRYIAGVSYPASAGSAIRTMRQSQIWQQHMRDSGYTGEIDGTKAARTIMDYYVRQRASREGVAKDIQAIGAWAAAHDIPADRVLIGEFGAWRLQPPATDDGSRARWIGDVRSLAEQEGFGWAFWEYTSPFGLVADDATRAIDPEVAGALGLRTDDVNR